MTSSTRQWSPSAATSSAPASTPCPTISPSTRCSSITRVAGQPLARANLHAARRHLPPRRRRPHAPRHPFRSRQRLDRASRAATSRSAPRMKSCSTRPRSSALDRAPRADQRLRPQAGPLRVEEQHDAHRPAARGRRFHRRRHVFAGRSRPRRRRRTDRRLARRNHPRAHRRRRPAPRRSRRHHLRDPHRRHRGQPLHPPAQRPGRHPLQSRIRRNPARSKSWARSSIPARIF